MCGIIGYTGDGPAAELVLDALSRLEYRGYDSAGVAVGGNGGVAIEKDDGRVDDLEPARSLEGSWGVGHTRWATHGAPTEANAHPHTGCGGDVALVHNGIVENHLGLRESLEGKGHTFTSETDSEVVAHLVGAHYDGDLREAVARTVEHLEGSYAFAAVHADEPGVLVGARHRSPLVVGVGDGENLLASDVTPLLDFTDRVIYLQDGDVVRVTADDFAVTGPDGARREPEVDEVDWDPEDAEKGGYEHYMLKEIHEQPRALHDVLRGRIGSLGSDLGVEGTLGPQDLADVDRIVVLAMGTSHHAGLVGGRILETWADVPVENRMSSEFRHGDVLPDEDTLVVAVSQSGETADTLEAIRRSRSAGAPVLALTNVPGSTITRDADGVLHLRAGPEISVAATKSFTNQLAAFVLLGLHVASLQGTITDPGLRRLARELRTLPRQIQQVVEADGPLEDLGRDVADHDHAFFLGRDANYGTALEGALKLKEISYIHAEGYAGGELKHGPMALLENQVPVVAIVGPDETRSTMLGNIGEVEARDARVLAVAPSDDEEIGKIASGTVGVPPTHPLLFPVTASVALQLLAYHAARARGCPIDKPRNLAKSVTVE
jgi:glucosamine--fructose-6-phosphate aminotransferase (isomerizing)